MRNKILESIYEKIILREQERLNNFEDSENDDFDPLEDVDNSKKDVDELVNLVRNLTIRYQNVIDGAKTEKSFFKELQDIIPMIKTALDKIGYGNH